MAIPDFQSFMLPLMQLVSDGNIHSITDVYEALANKLEISDDDRQQLLPSGKQKTYKNRIGWAATHLKKARLLDKPTRAKLQITELGRQVVRDNPEKITVRFLRQFPDYLTFVGEKIIDKENELEVTNSEIVISQPPEELIQEADRLLKTELATEILALLKSAEPAFLEKVVVDLLIAMGYGGSRSAAGKAIGKSGDGGVDGIISEDPLGLDNIYIQAKRWDSNVGRPVVQAFAGSLEGFRARKGVIITTSSFSKEAIDYVTRIEKKIILIDGKMLSELMVEHNVGAVEKDKFIVKKIDLDYFNEDE
jgi:restriction system protein